MVLNQICTSNEITQVVMSCRVVGLGVEFAALSGILKVMKDLGFESVTAKSINTDANLLSRNIFEKVGFIKHDAESWIFNFDAMPNPPVHLTLTIL